MGKSITHTPMQWILGLKYCAPDTPPPTTTPHTTTTTTTTHQHF